MTPNWPRSARRGGVYDTHQRDESSYSIGLMNSVKEVLQIGREAEIPVHFAHLKALGIDLQGQAPAVIRLIDEVPLFAAPLPLPVGSNSAISRFGLSYMPSKNVRCSRT